MSEDTSVAIPYYIRHTVRDGVEIGFVGTYTDPSTDTERTFVRDTYADAERAIRLDIAKRYGFDSIRTPKEGS